MAATVGSGWSANGARAFGRTGTGRVPSSPPALDTGRPVWPFAVRADRSPRVLPRVVRGDRLSDWKALEPRLGVKFKDPRLLRQALIHTSYLNENPGIDVGSNERLEFLGDAALGVVVAHELYTEYPDVDEGKLTELRAHLVRRDTLARAAQRLEIGEYLHLGRGEDAAGGRRRPNNLARAYEAVVGAIFLDGGLRKVRSFVLRTLGEDFEALRASGMPHDPKSRLQEIIQSRWQTTPSYRLLRTEGPDHARRFTVQVMVGNRALGVGSGRSKQAAEKDAAQQALEAIEGTENGHARSDGEHQADEGESLIVS
jgi:ribonuclease-3